jgi:hypothetical protein
MKNKILFKNFWKNKDITKIFLHSLFSGLDANGRTIILYSVFLKNSILKKFYYYLLTRFDTLGNRNNYNLTKYNLVTPITSMNTKNVWYTGENIRPPYDEKWDLTLSFENETEIRNNIFLPFWATTFGRTIVEAELKQNEYTSARSLQFKEKKFACAIIGNPEPFRMKIIHEISKIGEVDLYGSVFKNVITNKNKVISDYYFNICFENDLYPNYVTEKLFHSWEAGSVPIWWGLDQSGYINQEALINFASGSIESNLERLKMLLANPKEIMHMVNLPLLTKKYDYTLLSREINRILNER